MREDRKLRRRLLAAALSLLLACLVPAPIAFARATAADGTVDRLQVPAGGTVTVQVSGFRVVRTAVELGQQCAGNRVFD